MSYKHPEGSHPSQQAGVGVATQKAYRGRGQGEPIEKMVGWGGAGMTFVSKWTIFRQTTE